uniref:Uncharacterized protein n=1 Tax=Meloidogyne enterolobii TaxID=390850 RepID=A0A6V7XJQ9_MELEN|nr:unnamed protein product [Meloidogyne enterolobii]
MKTPKQIEEWSFSTINSDNVENDSNKIGDETPVEEEYLKDLKDILEEEDENLTEKSFSNILETSSIDGLSTTCSSFCSSQNMNESLKRRVEKLENRMTKKNLSLEKRDFDLEKGIQKLSSQHEKDIKNLKQNFLKLIEENNKQIKI